MTLAVIAVVVLFVAKPVKFESELSFHFILLTAANSRLKLADSVARFSLLPLLCLPLLHAVQAIMSTDWSYRNVSSYYHSEPSKTPNYKPKKKKILSLYLKNI